MTFRKNPIPFVFLLLLLSACGSGGGGTSSIGVERTDPAAGATNVSPTGPIRATFSTPIDPATVNADTFLVTGVSGEVSYQGQTATFTPAAPLAVGQMYHAVLTTGIKDLDGIPLPSNFVWSFSTGQGAGGGSDRVAPEIIAVFPQEDSADAAVDTPVRVIFSESVLAETLRSDTFFIQGVSGQIQYDDATHTATLQPAGPLQPNSPYQVTVTTDVRDKAGNPLMVWKSWSFTTTANSIPAAPAVVSTSPADKEGGVPLNTVVKATFNKEIDPQSLQGKFALQGPGGTEVAATLSYTPNTLTATLVPAAELQSDATYQAIVRKGVADLSGTLLPADVQWSFSTGTTEDRTPPAVIEQLPTGDNVSVRSVVTVRFSEPIKPETLLGHFTVISGGKTVPGWITYDAPTRTARLAPFGVKSNTTYTAVLTHDIEDLAGNHLSHTSWSWKTARRSNDEQ